MPTVAVIPVKSFRSGKLRLASAVDDPRRNDLGRAFASHVAETAERADMLPLIVTGDAEVAGWATAVGFPSLPDPGEGLSAAASAGTDWAAHSRSPWVVLHADLPLLQTEELSLLRDLADAGSDAIAPSSDGGTSAITASRQIGFSYGPGSFHQHLPRLRNPTVVTSTGLLHDIDTPSDLTAAADHPRGRWIEGYLS